VLAQIFFDAVEVLDLPHDPARRAGARCDWSGPGKLDTSECEFCHKAWYPPHEEKHSVEEIIRDPRQDREERLKATDASRPYSIIEQTYNSWRQKYGGQQVTEAQRLKTLEEENGRLKRLVADLSLDNQILKEVNSKKVVRPMQKWLAISRCDHGAVRNGADVPLSGVIGLHGLHGLHGLLSGQGEAPAKPHLEGLVAEVSR
jgi:putative transposase